MTVLLSESLSLSLALISLSWSTLKTLSGQTCSKIEKLATGSQLFYLRSSSQKSESVICFFLIIGPKWLKYYSSSTMMLLAFCNMDSSTSFVSFMSSLRLTYSKTSAFNNIPCKSLVLWFIFLMPIFPMLLTESMNSSSVKFYKDCIWAQPVIGLW